MSQSVNQVKDENGSEPTHEHWIEKSVTIPPGKLGIHLKDFESDVSSSYISSVSPTSPLAGKVEQGDSIIRVNGVDVRCMDTSSKKLLFESCKLKLPHQHFYLRTSLSSIF
jgi:C-terminal processing protease CtpA/Prc